MRKTRIGGLATLAIAAAVLTLAGCGKQEEPKAPAAQAPAAQSSAEAPAAPPAARENPPVAANAPESAASAPALPPVANSGKPNILVIFGDDIGQTNISAYSHGVVGYRTPNIDRIAREGMMMTDYYGENSCTAGRSTFITGEVGLRTGLLKVGIPGATVGLQAQNATIAEALKPLGYATGQFGKNHLGDRNEYLPTAHGFDEFYGNLYHLNAEGPERPYYPKNDAAFVKANSPRGVIHSFSDGKVEDTGPLTRKRMETIDDETTAAAIGFMEKQVKADKPFFVWMNTTRMHLFTHVRESMRGQSGMPATSMRTACSSMTPTSASCSRRSTT
jgi:arylsulfatase